MDCAAAMFNDEGIGGRGRGRAWRGNRDTGKTVWFMGRLPMLVESSVEVLGIDVMLLAELGLGQTRLLEGVEEVRPVVLASCCHAGLLENQGARLSSCFDIG